MKNSARAMLCVQQKNVLATTGRSHRHAKRPKIYRNVRENRSKERRGCPFGAEAAYNAADAVTHELDGALAYKLLTAFAVIPSPPKKAPPVKPRNDWEGIDSETMARAKVLGQVALERASLPPLDNDELEKLVQKDRVQSNRKSRLFANRD